MTLDLAGRSYSDPLPAAAHFPDELISSQLKLTSGRALLSEMTDDERALLMSETLVASMPNELADLLHFAAPLSQSPWLVTSANKAPSSFVGPEDSKKLVYQQDDSTYVFQYDYLYLYLEGPYNNTITQQSYEGLLGSWRGWQNNATNETVPVVK